MKKTTTLFVYGLLMVSGFLFSCTSLYADLLDTAFQPSKNLDQIITIGNTKNAVGNEVFRGSTEINAQIGLQPECFRVLNVVQNSCKQGAFWADGKCYQVPALGTNATQANCSSLGGEWRALGYIDVNFRQPLIVRVTQTLLRITIALAIPMIIFAGVRTIVSVFTGGDFKEPLKDVLIVLAGLVLALSAIGIIWLVQSITGQSLSGLPISL